MTQLGPSSSRQSISLPGRPGEHIEVSWAAATDTGNRRHSNEDSYVAHAPVFAVADGMGGHSAGDVASDAVVQRLEQTIVGDWADIREIEAALEAATVDIEIAAGDLELGVGTTVTGAALVLHGVDPYFAVFNVGDSRVYQFDHDELSQVTVDHSVVQELLDAGVISPESAEGHPESNVITRAVGFNSLPQPDYWMVPVRKGLRILICSDGLTKELSRDRLHTFLAAGRSANETATALVDAALNAGGRDNVTVVLIDVVHAPVDFELNSTSPRSGASSL